MFDFKLGIFEVEVSKEIWEKIFFTCNLLLLDPIMLVVLSLYLICVRWCPH